MRVLSFDVGIKNMAYCMFDVSASSVTIVDWNVLNLMDEGEGEGGGESKTCTCTNTPKTKKAAPTACKNKAKYSKGGSHYCEKHAKAATQFLLPTKQTSPTNLKKLKVDELFRLGNKHNIFLHVENPEKMKKTDLLNRVSDFFEKQCLEPIVAKKAKTAGETDLISIGRNMNELLTQNTYVRDITHVVIENQISPIANRMKTIQGMLAQYFIMKQPESEIAFVSSANKLQVKPLTNTNTIRETTEPTTYKKRKSDGVVNCSLFLDTNPNFSEWKSKMNTKKKDDLADCFLQGIWYIRKKGIGQV
jgi:hypothetical protein